MIWESAHWREQLLKDACGLRVRAQTSRITESRSIFIERTVFFAAYAMRRLDDAKKLSTSWSGSAVGSARHAPLGKMPNLLNWHRVEDFYNISESVSCTMSARRFCDLVIHSYIFLESIRDDRSVDGFFITSDKKRREGIWFFALDTVAGLMERTSQDDPSHVTLKFDEDRQDYDLQAKRP